MREMVKSQSSICEQNRLLLVAFRRTVRDNQVTIANLLQTHAKEYRDLNGEELARMALRRNGVQAYASESAVEADIQDCQERLGLSRDKSIQYLQSRVGGASGE